MTKQIAIIDPFVKSPALHCFNDLVSFLRVPASYHMPHLTGLSSLKDGNDAYIVLGSASHIGEDYAWHSPLADFLIKELERGKPVLGCCFGHQLMCHAFGSKVEFHHSEKEKLSGLRVLEIKNDFWNFKAKDSFTLAVTHRQVVRDLPGDLLNMSSGYPNDIVIHRSLLFLGTQAHPEASANFCLNDVQNMTEHEVLLAQKDGRRFISRFFQHFQII